MIVKLDMILLVVLMTVMECWGNPGSAPPNINVKMLTYLGDGSIKGINNGTGTAVDKAGNVYVAGAGPYNYGLQPEGNTSSNGYILMLDSKLKPKTIYRLASQTGGLQVRDTKKGAMIMIWTDQGVFVMDGTFQQQIMVAPTCNLTLCVAAMGADGTVAVLNRYNFIQVYDSEGKLTATKTLDIAGYTRHFSDIAVDPVNKRVILGYFYQTHPHKVPVQIPCIIAYDYTLTKEEWVDYCQGGDTDYDTQNMADSRILKVFYSDVDNKLYFAGYTDGGDSVFRYNPLDIAKNHGSLKGLKMMDSSRLVAYDAYTTTYNFHGAHSLTFVARVDPKDGSVEKGQFIVARQTDGTGNSVATNAIAGGKGGILVAAESAVSSIENRDNQTVNGDKTAPYGGMDGVLLTLSSDFTKRLIWNQFEKTSGHSSGVAIAANTVGDKTRVSIIVQSKEAEFIEVNQLTGTGHAKTTSVNQDALVVVDV